MEELKVTSALIATEVIKSLAKDMATFLKEKVVGYYTDTTKKEQVDSKWAFEDYLIRAYGTYSMSKTILYGDKPRKLSSFFVPVDMELYNRKSSNKKQEEINKDPQKKKLILKNMVSSKSVSDVLEQSNKLIITGIGGMGKTMLLKHFCVNSIENGYKIPVFISLRRLNNANFEDKTIEKLIYEQLEIFGFELDFEYFEYSLNSDKYLFLFDGYDEVSKKKMPVLTFNLSNFVRRHSKNSFIIASREIDEIYSWDDFTLFSLCNMSRGQTIQLIWKLDYDYEIRKRFIKELDDTIYIRYKSFASVPLLLSILFMTYVANTRLPDSLNDFYEKAFETLMFKHDRMKMGFERIFSSGLPYEVFRKIFIRFCFVTYFKELYTFSYRALSDELYEVIQKMQIDVVIDAYISDIVNISCMLIRDGQEYAFLHRSFQEYFTAVLVSQKTDEEQQKLCAAFINSRHRFILRNSRNGIEEILSDMDPGLPSIAISQNRKNAQRDSNTDFLCLLQSVEPDRFENIVIEPIMKKVHEKYSIDFNLVNTAYHCSYLFMCSFMFLFMKNGVCRKISFSENNVNELYVKESEYTTLRFFYPYELMIGKVNNTDMQQWDKAKTYVVLLESYYREKIGEDIRIDGSADWLENYQTCIDELRYIDMIIKKYESICAKKREKDTLSDLILNNSLAFR